MIEILIKVVGIATDIILCFCFSFLFVKLLASKYRKIIRHQMRKRCLAMAKYAFENHLNMVDCYRCSTLPTASFRMNFGVRWNCRWRELAEKFKEVK